MQTITSRTYTNVALTAIVLLLALLALRPYVQPTSAWAQETARNEQQRIKTADLNPNAENAAATRELAEATREIADAIRGSSKAQEEMAAALKRLGDQ